MSYAAAKLAKALVLFGLGTALMLPAAPGVLAADLEVTRVKRAKVHHKLRVVRDYDGTPVVMRRTRVVQPVGDGTIVETWRTEMIPAMRATPYYYLNGESVLPHARPL